MTEEKTIQSAKWYAIHLKSNFEARVCRILKGKFSHAGADFEAFYPSYHVKSLRRGKEHTIEKPVFPGYIFAKFELNYLNKVKILETQGVASIVKFKNRYAPVDEQTVKSLLILNQHKNLISPHPFIEKSTRVVVKAGPLRGVCGVVAGRRKVKSKMKVVVNVEILRRSIAVTIDPVYLEPQ